MLTPAPVGIQSCIVFAFISFISLDTLKKTFKLACIYLLIFFIAESSTALLSSGKAARYVLYTTPRQSYKVRINDTGVPEAERL